MSAPYYTSPCGRVTLHHGDCLEIAPGLTGIGAVVSDPPYGMRYTAKRRGTGSRRWEDAPLVHGDDVRFDPSPWLGYDAVVLWGANWYADRLPPSGGWIVWDKTPRGSRKGFTQGHAELAWTNVGGRVLKCAVEWGGEQRNGEGFFHPTQKPVELMEWTLENYVPAGALVLDPYMGSAPVGLAAVKSGRSYIGIEIEERHAETAARRIDAALAQTSLFAA